MAIRRPNQMAAVTGQRNLGFDQLASLRARQKYLPTILAQEQATQQRQEDVAFREKQLKQEKSIAKDELAFQRDQSKKLMGLEAAKLGTTMANSEFIRGIGGKLGAWGPSSGPGRGFTDKQQPVATKAQIQSGTGSRFGSFDIGGGLAGGLSGGALGFGLGSMVKGGKYKWLGAGLGAFAGGLLGGGLNIGSALSGGSFFGGSIT